MDNNISKLDTSISVLVKDANNFVVNDKISNEIAVGVVKDIKSLEKEICDTFDPMIKKNLEAHRESLAQKKKKLDPLVEAEKILKAKITAWDTEQERLRKIEAQRIEAENRKKLDDEIKRREEEALEQASKMESKEMQDMVLENAIETPVEVPNLEEVPEKEKVQGSSFKINYKYKIIDITKINREFLIPDEVKIGALVRNMKKDAESIIGGIEVYEEKVANIRRW